MTQDQQLTVSFFETYLLHQLSIRQGLHIDNLVDVMFHNRFEEV